MHNIALMPGDGIGPEITRAAVRVIEATGVDVQWVELKGGEGVRQERGTPLPDETLESYIRCGVGFKGPFTVEMEDAVVSPEWRRGIPGGRPPRTYNSATNALRREGGGFAAIRLARNFNRHQFRVLTW
jgi:isocitrate/isopropylmalate dehydrogenase